VVIRADRDDGEKKYLVIYQKNNRVSKDLKLGKPPCEVTKIVGDTIFVVYYVLSDDNKSFPFSKSI